MFLEEKMLRRVPRTIYNNSRPPQIKTQATGASMLKLQALKIKTYSKTIIYRVTTYENRQK